MVATDILDVFTKLFLAALFGGIIGYERKNSGKPAGLRTNMLICIGSSLVMILSQHLSYTVSESDLLTGRVYQKTIGDPGRLAAQVISGIGFLGAGAILHSRATGSVVGLTTAATIWTNASIGLATGAGYYTLASITTGFVMFTLYVIKIIETKTGQKHPRPRTLLIIIKKIKKISQLKKEIYRKGIFIDSESIKKRMDEVEYRADINISPLMEEILLNHLSEDDNILSFNITNVQ
ncbi:MAG: MgtC/SapB family protein [Leptospiraceae bacterium]|nr:MgtC/SapB family protein [Leptospiraceae bacterium]